MTALDAASALPAKANLTLAQGKALPTLGNSADRETMKKSAQQFEAVFLSQMFGQMFEGVGTDSLFGGGHGEEMFRSMLVDEYGKLVAKRGGVGIADAVLRTLVHQQEKTG